MNKFYLLLVCILSLGSSHKSFGQGASQLQWVFNAANSTDSMWGGNNEGKSIATDASGNRYVTGYFEGVADFDPSAGIANLTAVGGKDIFIAKYGSNGNYLWAKAIGGVYEDTGNSIALNSSGEIYVTGYFWSTVDFDPSGTTANLTSEGSTDIFLTKYDNNGNYLWAKAMGGTSMDQAKTVVVNSGGEVYVTGYFGGTADFDPTGATTNLTAVGGKDIFIAKYGSNGNYLWAKAVGGIRDDEANALTLDSSGQVYITGYTGGGDFDPSAGISDLTAVGGKHFFIAKYDSSGNYLWAKLMGSSSSTEVGNSLVVKSDGNIYVTGYFHGGADFDPSTNNSSLFSISGSNDIFIAGYNSSGVYLWAKAMGGAGSDEGCFLAMDRYENLFVVGSFVGTADFDPSSYTTNLVSNGGSDQFIAYYDTDNSHVGGLMYAYKMGGTKDDRATSIAIKINGNENDHDVYVTGSFRETADFGEVLNPWYFTAGTGASNCFIGCFYATYAGGLDIRSVQVIGGYPMPSNEWGRWVAVDSFGNVYVLGGFSGAADFDPSAATATMTAAMGGEMFLAKYDSNGNYLWAKAIGGANGNESPKAIAINPSGEVIIGGYFYDTTDFDPSAATVNLTSLGDADLFIAKYDSNGNYVWAKSMGGTDHECMQTMVLNGSGEIYIMGEMSTGSSPTDFDPSATTAILYSINSSNSYIAKYDTNGNYLWAKVLGGASGFIELGSKLAVNSSGEVYLGGGFRGTIDFDLSAAMANLASGNQLDIFIVKYDSNGNYLWAKSMGGVASQTDAVKSIAVNGSGEVYVTGTFGGTVDFDPSAATANLTATGGISNLFMAKYDSSGNYIWAKATGVMDYFWDFNPSSLALSSNGDMYIGGVFLATGDFDPSAAQVNLTPAGNADSYIAKYDSNGNYLWAKAIGGPGNDYVNSIALNSDGALYATGYFYDTTDFETSNTCNGTLTALREDMFLAKYANGTCTAVTTPTVTHTGNTLTVNSTADAYQWIDCNNGSNPVQGATNQSFVPAVSGNYAVVLTTGCCQNTSACQTVLGVNDEEIMSVTLYPNPTTGNFIISWADALESAEIVVTDIMGKTIKKMQCKGQQEASLSLDGAANGIYFVRLQSGQKVKQFKLIKK